MIKDFLSYNRTNLAESDPEMAAILAREARRLSDGIELIASENVQSPAVLATLSNVMSNKYAEGYPGRRYYGGCEHVDEAEALAIERVKKLFGCDYANVQPHSGAQANQAVYLAYLQAGETLLGMDLSHGGHLTHGSPVSSSGILYKAEHYGVNEETGRIDYDAMREKARAVRPKVIVAGASAYPRVIDFQAFRSVADEVGAVFLVDMAHIAGLVAAGIHPSPIPHAHVVTSTTHKTLRGPRGGIILSSEEHAKALNKAVFPGLQGGPLMHVIAAKGVAFGEALDPSFKIYQEQVARNAQVLASSLMENGVSLVSGGTDNHLMLVDLRKSDLSGKDAEARLALANITVNKNTVPGETRKPMVTSGIRIGTPAVTSRGLKEDDVQQLGRAVAQVLANTDSGLSEAREIINGLCKKFPLYDGSLQSAGYVRP